jgi:hypothetical protein
MIADTEVRDNNWQSDLYPRGGESISHCRFDLSYLLDLAITPAFGTRASAQSICRFRSTFR